MRPFINWAGSRERDLGVILPLIPKDIETFVDPFVGDGACFLAAEARSYAVADKNQDLVDAWRCIQTNGPRLRALIPELVKVWQNCDPLFEEIRGGLLEVKHSVDSGLFAEYPAKVNAIIRIVDKVPYDELFPTPLPDPFDFTIELRHQAVVALEQMNEDTDDNAASAAFYTAFKASVFQYLVEVYNKPDSKNTLRTALLVFLMEYVWHDKFIVDAGQFRPEYGGQRVNRRSIEDRIDTILSPILARKMAATNIYCQDVFRSFGFPFAKEEGNFLFLDVPKVGPKTLSQAGHKRLATFLRNGTKARWMAICDPNDIIVDLLLYEEPRQICHVIPLGKEIIIMNY